MENICSLHSEYIFHVFYDKTGEEVCRIKYTETVRSEEATLDMLIPDKIPTDIKIGDKSTKALLVFLKDRVLPPNRMFLAEALAPLGINPHDWKSLIQMNKGKTYGDNYSVIMERLSNEDIQSSS